VPALPLAGWKRAEKNSVFLRAVKKCAPSQTGRCNYAALPAQPEYRAAAWINCQLDGKLDNFSGLGVKSVHQLDTRLKIGARKTRKGNAPQYLLTFPAARPARSSPARAGFREQQEGQEG
jgi:hypothetical protein